MLSPHGSPQPGALKSELEKREGGRRGAQRRARRPGSPTRQRPADSQRVEGKLCRATAGAHPVQASAGYTPILPVIPTPSALSALPASPQSSITRPPSEEAVEERPWTCHMSPWTEAAPRAPPPCPVGPRPLAHTVSSGYLHWYPPSIKPLLAPW